MNNNQVKGQFIESNENPVHLRFERFELLQSKKNLLESKQNILRIIRAREQYRILRDKELRLKIRLYRKIKDIGNRLRKLQTSIPEVRVPGKFVSEKFEPAPRKPLPARQSKKEYNNEIENELRAIQAKLDALQQ